MAKWGELKQAQMLIDGMLAMKNIVREQVKDDDECVQAINEISAALLYVYSVIDNRIEEINNPPA